MLMTENNERIYEENKLSEVLKKLLQNIDYYSKSNQVFSKKIKTVKNSNELNVISNHLELIEKNLRNNNTALLNPYFGRIDYTDKNESKEYSLYIGKHGIQDTKDKTLTVDWRAPISSVYYDCQLGENKIELFDNEELDLELKLKRTIEIDNSELIEFYDVNTVAADELLTKYLAKNKEAVLSEIVATIQKDQNRIIRDSYFHNIIVQGGAGSGKTTVAMHRVSFLLYNYKDIFNSENFYILGSNKMFLNYITSILPSLDVAEIKNMVLSSFLYDFVAEYIPKAKNKFNFIDRYTDDNRFDMSFKGKIGFVKALDKYLKIYEHDNIPVDNIALNGYVVMEKGNIRNLMDTFRDKSMQEKITILNDQLKNKIIAFVENNPTLKLVSNHIVDNSERIDKGLKISSKDRFEDLIKDYSKFFGDNKNKLNIISIYIDFLLALKEKFKNIENLSIYIKNIDNIIISVKESKFDIFDLSMLNLIKKRLCSSKKNEDVRYIVVDEAQDFGASIFYVLRNVFDKSYFAIMGDISQNINYDIGMNDWECLTNDIFASKHDKFYTLSKSYRNTIEISNLAIKVLKKAEFKTYDIEPFVRHGKDPEIINAVNFEESVEQSLKIINDIIKDGFKTIAVICRTQEEADMVSTSLSKHTELQNIKADTESNSINGVMVMPIQMSKGLEFDAVILWNVNSENYSIFDSDIKLLYVAITRALHELYVLYTGKISELLI
jgi:DNA helicase-2/ATP-dependent DNA helicase PcrA